MPNTTQPVTTPSGGTLGVSCYSSSSHLSPLVDLRKNGTRIWSQTPSAGTDPCPHTAIADAAGNVYAVLSTSDGSELRAYSPAGVVRWTVSLGSASPWRTDNIALGWNGSLFLQLFNGSGALVEGFSEATGARTFDVGEYDGDGIYPYSGGIALAQPQGTVYYSYRGKEIGSTQLSVLSAYEAYSAAGGPDGTVFVAGWESSCGSKTFSVSKITPAGLAWTKTDPDETVCGQTSLSATPDGGVVLSWNQGAGSWLYRSYDSSGSVRWTESPPDVPASATGYGGYIAPIVDESGDVGLPYEYSYACADQSLTCQGFQIDLVSENTGGETYAPVVVQHAPGNAYLDGADAGPGYLYVGAAADSSGGTTSNTIDGFAVPGLTVSYPASLEPGQPLPAHRYVAMGDSIPYGHGLADPGTKGHDGLPPNQPPSPRAYPSLVANAMGYRLSVRSSYCTISGGQLAVSGAPMSPKNDTGKWADCSSGGREPSVLPTELDAASLASSPPELVTIQGGADDINFAGCLEYALGAPGILGGEKCSSGNSVTPTIAARLTNVTAALTTLLSQIKSETGGVTRIAVVNYYQPIPAPGDFKSDGSQLCKLLSLHKRGAYHDAEVIQAALNGAIAKAVAKFPKVKLVNISKILGATHGMCAAHPWLFTGSLTDGNFWRAVHPTAAGQAAIARAVEQVVGRA